MEILVNKTAEFVAQFEKDHPNHADLPKMRQFVADGQKRISQGKPVDKNSAVSTSEPIVKSFSQSTLKDLERSHALVYDPFETSLNRLVGERKPFWYIVSRDDERFMSVLSRPSQVAIFPEPERLYVPNSNRKSLEAQKRRLAEDVEEEIKGKMHIGGVNMIIDNVATHAGLVFAHLGHTGARLHGKAYGYNYARTETPTVGSPVAHVGSFHEVDGLRVARWYRVHGHDSVWALRLVVPSQE